MKENNIRIEHIPVSELETFAEQAISEAGPGGYVPISMQRAIAHAHNPYAQPDDVALLAAIDGDNEVVGYFGILPILLKVGEQTSKAYWFTTWSVSSKVRGQGVGSALMKEALTLDLDFLIVGSVHARRVCQRYGFWERDPLTYYWIDMSGMGKLNPLTWILRFVRKTTHIFKSNRSIKVSNSASRWLDKMLSPLTKRFFYPLFTRVMENYLQEIKVLEVDQIRDDLVTPLNQPQYELHRGVDAINWMLKYPWIVEQGESQTEGMDYYFSDSRPLYRLIALEVSTQAGVELGFVVFSVSQKSSGTLLKMLDFDLGDKAHYALALAAKVARKYEVDTIEVPMEVVKEFSGTVLGKLLLLKKTRIYQCHPRSGVSPLAKCWHELQLHLYDGDMAFS